jgi:transcriptional regulator with XRE-family HTH domain
MQDDITAIANRVRGVAAEHRASQGAIAATLGLSLGSVNARMNGKVPFTGAELLKLSRTFGVDASLLFPPTSGALAASPAPSQPGAPEPSTEAGDQ